MDALLRTTLELQANLKADRKPMTYMTSKALMVLDQICICSIFDVFFVLFAKFSSYSVDLYTEGKKAVIFVRACSVHKMLGVPPEPNLCSLHLCEETNASGNKIILKVMSFFLSLPCKFVILTPERSYPRPAETVSI